MTERWVFLCVLLLAPYSATCELYLPSIVSDSGVTKVVGHGLTVHRDSVLTEVEGDHTVLAYTWGIGGPRVGRPKNSEATPARPVEGLSPTDSVVHISASGHSALVTNAGMLYTCGRNDSAGGGGHGSPPIKDAGQLGREGPGAHLLPVTGGGLSRERVVASACGRYHTAALTASGAVYTFGLNDYGQLGRAGVMGRASAGGCICDSGGDCSCGATGSVQAKPGDVCVGGSSCRSGIPGKVDLGATLGRGAVAVAAGRYTTMAVLATGEVVGWGLNLCAKESDRGSDTNFNPNELSNHPDRASIPRMVPGFGGPGEPKAVAVDIGYIHIVILAEDGKVYSCHTGYDGYAGGLPQKDKPGSQHELGRIISSTEQAFLPGLVEGALSGLRAVAIATGRCHTLIATDEGKVFSFGCNILGRERGSQDDPGLVRGLLESEKAVGVAAGEHFSLVVTASGKVFGWGDSGSGQMGEKIPRTNSPVRVPLPLPDRRDSLESVHALTVVAGYQHAAAAVILKP
mmetsp:Transcript_11508/g.21828  ORF Transcript_11508/g.21828 Transcript_11508/m.21828 type:complete len:515 (+) Transcript_11508:67-1611(+)